MLCIYDHLIIDQGRIFLDDVGTICAAEDPQSFYWLHKGKMLTNESMNNVGMENLFTQ